MTPSLFAAIVVVAGALSGATSALWLGLVFCLFGAAAALSLPALGGATITPSVMFLPFLLLRACLAPGARRPLSQVSVASFFLCALAVWGLLSALLFPRLFAGEMQILTVDRAGGNGAALLLPLGPVSGNITQSGYAIGGLLSFIAVRRLLASGERLATFADAALWLGALNCAAALLNLAEFYLGLPSLLSYVRTGNYAIFDAYEEAGLMRVQGTFSETSAFSAFTLPLFAFALSLWMQRVRAVFSGGVAACSLLLLLLSTSTTAYSALALYLLGFGFSLAARAYLGGGVPRADALLLTALLGVLLLAVVCFLRPQFPAAVGDFLQATVLGKLDTNSGFERSAWNRQAWSNFIDTFGLGVGLGSARASGFFLVLLSNVGVIGALLFAGFIVAVCRAPSQGNDVESAMMRAARQAVLAGLIAALISAAVFDLGVAFYAFAAAASATSARARARAGTRRSESAARWRRAAASQPC